MGAATPSTPSPHANGGPDHILRPRPIKPTNPLVLRTQSEERSLKVDGGAHNQGSGISSGRSTPLPDDAPPSAVSISYVRKEVRAQQKHRLFPSIDYAARVSHFDAKSEYRDFRGFFVLFWIGLAIMVITTMLRNIKDTGYPFRHQVLDLMTTKTWQLGLSDGAMVASTALCVYLQQVFRSSKGWLSWNALGMPIQSLLQIGWLTLWINWPFILRWTWTAQVFFTLHTLVILMKMHSYAFYNGHLSHTERRLFALDNPETASTAAAVKYPSPGAQINSLDEAAVKKKKDDKDDALTQLREDLAMELVSPLGGVTYPQNLTMWNYADYILCPTLCYEMEYPRTEGTQWMELLWKTLAVFGCIFLLTVISEEFIVPVLNEAALKLQKVSNITDMGLIILESISLMLFPFMVTFLLVFLVIFEYLLGAFAEITCFADRHFYSDWWNSCDWLEFSREWNIPVHHFLRRHVYGASRPYMSRNMSTVITFLVSALGHELVMGCITKKLRGYGFVAQMLQLPIVAVQRSRIIRSRKLLNNVLFWCSMISGLAIMCALWAPHHNNAHYTATQLFGVNVALSVLNEALDSAYSHLQALSTKLPPVVQGHLTTAHSLLQKYGLVEQGSKDPETFFSQIAAFFLDKTSVAALFAVLGPLLILVFSMSGWWPSGRYSPFASYTARGPPPVTQDDYTYLDSDRRPQGHHEHYQDPTYTTSRGGTRTDNYGPSYASSARPSIHPDLDLDPDILILKHKGTTYPLHFPAFSIAESLKVGELRRQAARETKCDDPRRVKLLYKGRSLRDDSKPCREEGLKQNSELMCVVSSDPTPTSRIARDDGNESSSSASEAAIANGVEAVSREPRTKRKGHRGTGNKKRREDKDGAFDDNPRGSASSFLSPPNGGPGAGADRSASRDRPTASPSPTPSSAAPAKKPTTPAEILQAVSDDFNTNFLPKVHHLLEHPPKSEKERDYESKKLSEGILTQVLFKLDGVQTDDEGMKARRKECVKLANFWSGELDKLQKK